MRRTFRRTISAVLALITALSLAVTSFAELTETIPGAEPESGTAIPEQAVLSDPLSDEALDELLKTGLEPCEPLFPTFHIPAHVRYSCGFARF